MHVPGLASRYFPSTQLVQDEETPGYTHPKQDSLQL